MTRLICGNTSESITLLGKPIGSHSGEGTVWRTNHGYLAKIYHSPTPERVQKLAVMIAHPPTEPNYHLNHISFAWPKSVLKNEQGDCVGFLMPEVKGGKELIEIYNLKRRKALKLEIDWRFLHTTALNIASIIAALHDAGYVLGDIKPQNILVNNRALPSIIDTDSFQVKNPKNGKVYRCLVGSEGYTPPELIEQDFFRIEQTEIHDRFRLAVIIYQLLFGGETPFQGKWTGAGDTPQPNELIRRGLWLYSPNSLIQPVNRTIPLEIVHPEIQQCFLRCFNDGHKNPHLRPTAREWLEALRVGNDSLTLCGRVDSHYYSRTYGKCYWCDRSTKLGVDIFPGVVKANSSPVVESTSQPQDINSDRIGNLLQTLTGHAYSVRSVAFSPDSQTLASGSRDETIKLWDVRGEKLLQTLRGHSDWVNCVAFSPNGQILASGSRDKTIKLWDLSRGKLLQTLTGHSSPVNCVTFSTDGQTLASGSSDKAIKLWDVSRGKLLQTLTGHSNWVNCVDFSPDSQTLASGSSDNTIKLWDVREGKLLQILTGHSQSVNCVAFSPDNQTLASGSSDNTIKMWDVREGKLLQTFSGHSNWVFSIAFSPDGQILASGSSDKTIKLWDVSRGKLLQTLTGDSEWVNCVAFSPNGQTLASGSLDNTIKIWQIAASIATSSSVKQSQSQVSPPPVSKPQSQPVITQVTATSTTNTTNTSSLVQPTQSHVSPTNQSGNSSRQVSQPQVSKPQSQPVITQATATSTTNTSSLVQPTQSHVSPTNQSGNLSHQVSPPPVSKPQSPLTTHAPQTTLSLKNTKPRKILLASTIVGLMGISICFFYVLRSLLPTNIQTNNASSKSVNGRAVCRECGTKYPEAARKRGIEGRVVVAVDTDEKGNVTNVRIVNSSGNRDLDEETLRQARNWKLKPSPTGWQGVSITTEYAIRGSRRERELQKRKIP